MMQRLFYFLIISIIWLLTSCDLQMSDNGDLDGFWQLCSVDTLATGQTVDMRQSQVSWAVQGSLLETRIAEGIEIGTNVVFRFEHHPDSLWLYAPYLIDRDQGDIQVADVTVLRPFGINELEERFGILQLDGDALILQSKQLRLHFRKY